MEQDNKKIEITGGYGWAGIIYECQMPDYDKIKNEIVNFIKDVKLPEPKNFEYSGIGPHKQPHKKFLEESYANLFDNQENKIFNEIKRFCLNSVLNVAVNVNSNFTDVSHWIIKPLDSWYHITKNKGYHDVHAHPYASWCGIFYVDIGDANIETQNGINRFYSPMSDVINQLVGNEYIGVNSIDAAPEDGKLLIFPGFIKHSALPYFGKKDRIIISFNAEIGDSRIVLKNNN